jgi:hypothetical protein
MLLALWFSWRAVATGLESPCGFAMQSSVGAFVIAFVRL